MVLVNYTGLNVFTLNAVGAEPIRLLPGINEISAQQLAAAEKHPAFESFKDAGKIVVLNETRDGERTVKEMIGIINKTFDTKLLKQILAKDKREAVQKAASAQLELISVSKKAETVEENEHFK